MNNWRQLALCHIDKNKSYWFSYKHQEVEYAKNVCASCAVRKECLAHMWETDSFYGVNGGLSEYDVMIETWKKAKKDNDKHWSRTDTMLQKLLRKVQ